MLARATVINTPACAVSDLLGIFEARVLTKPGVKGEDFARACKLYAEARVLPCDLVILLQAMAHNSARCVHSVCISQDHARPRHRDYDGLTPP